MNYWKTTICDVAKGIEYESDDSNSTATTWARSVLKLLGFRHDSESSDESTEVWRKGAKIIAIVSEAVEEPDECK